MRFYSLKRDSNVFRREYKIISTYIADFMITSPSRSRSQIQDVIATLSKAFQIKDLGDMTKILSSNIQNDSDSIFIYQQGKIDDLCEDGGMIQCKWIGTPISDDNLIGRETEKLLT